MPTNIFSKFAYYVLEWGKTSYIKRVIGLPGEHVQIMDGKVYINGEELDESAYLNSNVKTEAYGGMFTDIIVPEGCVFAMGDNRSVSADCRRFGCIPLKKIEGKENREIVEIQKEENYLEELTKTYELTEKVEWKNVTGEEKIQIKGRSLGGCLDCVKGYIGTKYDKVSEYVERHKKEGLIWFLEVFEMSTPEVYRTLWQMKNAGYFKYCTGIVFGRPLFIREDYETNFNDTVKEALQDLEIPIICDADIGHVKPQLAIVNGAILEITSQNGKGTVKTILE